ncbi:MAG: ABC transporter substrate-binding protein [Hyphomicrobiales bacterium]
MADSCPTGAVEKAGTAMITAAKSGSPSAFAGALRNYADMNSIAMFALGRYKSSLPAGQRDDYVNAVTSYVSRTLNDFRLKFNAESIKVKDCDGPIVNSSIFFLGGKGYQPVLWRMKGSRVADVNVQNVWLAQLLRDNVTGILDRNNGNFKALMAELKK